MAERIELPPQLSGDEKNQLQQVWSYLYQLSNSINNNLEGIGGNELTDSERKTMDGILHAAGDAMPEAGEVETLKSLIIKTADFVQTKLQEYRMNLLGETVASGKFGRYVRSTGLDVAVTPEGIMQNYSFQEIIQGLKLYEINAKNYIKTGLLRMNGSIPVYGVAIGKDVVTFAEDGTETYHDGNKVAELTADELSFWQNGVKIAGYTGSRISFYYNGNEVFYIQNGKLYSTGDIELAAGKSIKFGNVSINGEWVQQVELTEEGLKTRMTNAEGDISTLEATAAGLTTRMTNAEGDISTLEATASSLTTRMSSAEGDISTLEATAGSLTTRMSSAEGNITTLQTTASGLSSRMSTAEGNITTLTATAAGLRTDVDNKIAKTTAYQDAQSIVSAATGYTDGQLTSYSTTTQMNSAIALYVGNNAYQIVSGIDIAAAGIDITGAKYVKIRSGGSFNVDATNFKVDSENKIIKIGDWDLSPNGLNYGISGDPFGFEVARYADMDENTTGVFYRNYTTGNQKYGEILLGVCSKNYNDNPERTFFRVGAAISESGHKDKYIVPGIGSGGEEFVSYIGTSLMPFSVGHIQSLFGNVIGNVTGNVTGNVLGDVTGELNGNIVKSSGTVYIYPKGTSDKKLIIYQLTVSGIKRIQIESDTDLYIKDLKFANAATGDLIGNVTGNVSGSAGSVPWSGVTGKPNESKKITQVGGYFTERDAFKAVRVGDVMRIDSYINITTQVPAYTNFGYTGFPTATGIFLFIKENGSGVMAVDCVAGYLQTKSALPTGYYYAIGMATVT